MREWGSSLGDLLAVLYVGPDNRASGEIDTTGLRQAGPSAEEAMTIIAGFPTTTLGRNNGDSAGGKVPPLGLKDGLSSWCQE